MAIAKITLTLEQDEQQGTNAAMEETIQRLAELTGMPIDKLVLTLECEEVIAESYRDKLRVGLKKRPMGINIKMSTKVEESVAREWVKPETPMDRAGWEAGKTTGERVLDFLVAREQRAGAGDENLFDDEA